MTPPLFFAIATVISLQALALTFDPLRRVLGLAPPPALEWLLLAMTIVLPIAIVETQKAIARRRAGPTPASKKSVDDV